MKNDDLFVGSQRDVFAGQLGRQIDLIRLVSQDWASLFSLLATAKLSFLLMKSLGWALRWSPLS